MSVFSVTNLTAGYGGKAVVDGVSFSAEAGCLLGILGANGSGKTTLIKSICGILPHGGQCCLDGQILEALTPRQLGQRCGYIPQRSGISIDISALDVVLMGFNPQLRLLEHPSAAMREAARKRLAQVGLGDREEENYLTLSEGQKQLCILARTLAADKSLLVLDEPESALDFPQRHRMLGMLTHWLTQGNRWAIVTLHDPALALNYCHRLLLLRDGKLQGQLRPKVDSLATMEALLETVYGPIRLTRCQDRSGQSQLVMLYEGGTPSWKP